MHRSTELMEPAFLSPVADWLEDEPATAHSVEAAVRSRELTPQTTLEFLGQHAVDQVRTDGLVSESLFTD